MDILQYIVAKLLWSEKRGRIGIDPDISFLCIRATNSTKEDKAKLRQVLQYPKRTINDKGSMGADSLSQLCTWVNATSGVRHDLKPALAAECHLDMGCYIKSPSSIN